MSRMPEITFGLGRSIEKLRARFGKEVEVHDDWPDRYAPSFSFLEDQVEILATILPDCVTAIDVLFPTAPADPIEVLLAQYSGMTGWHALPNSDPMFEHHFRGYNPAGNRTHLFSAPGAVALVQRATPLGQLSLFMHREDYPMLLREFRARKARD